jgi:hypothetical protein
MRNRLHKPDDGRHLDDSKDKFGLTVALDAKEIDDDNRDEEYGNKDSPVYLTVPVLDGDGGGDDLQRQDNDPVEGVAEREESK